MTQSELLVMIKAALKDCDCPHRGEHVYKLAVSVLERQREDDAVIASTYSAEAAEAIRSV